jgi:hypothetical protein
MCVCCSSFVLVSFDVVVSLGDVGSCKEVRGGLLGSLCNISSSSSMGGEGAT